VTEFSQIGNSARYAHIAKTMGENVTGLTNLEVANMAAMVIKTLMEDIKTPSLSELGVDKGSLIYWLRRWLRMRS
jgi:hypothetical protein